MQKNITRREFIKNSAAATIVGAGVLGSTPHLFAGDVQKSRVVLIRDEKVVGESGQIDAAVLQNMLDRAVTTLFGETDARKAWQRIVYADDTVGIKTNNWRSLHTPPELEDHLMRRIKEAGVPEERIGKGDHGILSDPVFKNATALINTRPMRTHDWAGVGSCIKNYIMFVPRPSDYHGDSCADLATIWKLPHVQGKTRLNILVMLTPLFHGTGPHHFNPEYTWKYNGLIIGTDVVAVDATGVRIIQAKRRAYFGDDRPINPPPKHIFLADTRHHLGNANPEKIELLKLGWEKDILI